MENEFKSQFERVIGGKSEQEREKVKNELQELIKNPDERVKPYEVEKTEKDKELINFSETAVDKIVTFYGGKPYPIPLEKIHLLKPESVNIITKGKFCNGAHSILGQDIIIDKEKSELGLTLNIVHELLHLKSYKAAQIKEENKPDVYRSGIQIMSRKSKTEYFGDIEEAIVSKLTDKIYNDEFKNNSLFKKELEITNKFKGWIKMTPGYQNLTDRQKKIFSEELYSVPIIEDAIESIENGELKNKPLDYKLGYIVGVFEKLKEQKSEIVSTTRQEEKEKIDEIINEIYEKSKIKMSKEKIFDEFAKANFSGNLLPLAKMIESSLGKGYFRKITNKFSK